MKKILVLLAAVAMVASFTLPAMAADWGFYGSARMSTFWDDDDKEVTGALFDDEDLTWGLQGNSRIGARVKAGDIGGRFEYGTGINLRLLYGTWNFGAGTILVGQDYTPINVFYSNQVYAGDTDLLPYGGIYDGRVPQLKLMIKGFQLCQSQPSTGAVTGIPFAAENDTTIPEISASYDFAFGPLKVKLLGSYGSYDVADTATDREYSVDSYFYGLGLQAGFGPFTIAGNVWGAQNQNSMGMWTAGNTWATPAWNAATNNIDDVDDFGFYLLVNFKVNDMLTLEAGYGYAEHELDQAGGWEDDVASWYLQCTINIAKGFFVVPEIGQVDYKDRDIAGVSVDQGDTTYFGAKWQINF